jgi:hypothetical protein
LTHGQSRKGSMLPYEWAVLEPLVEACRPHSKVPPSNLRRTISLIP